MLIGIINVLLGVATLWVAIIPKKHHKASLVAIGVVMVIFGIWNVIEQDKSVEGLKDEVRKYGTTYDFDKAQIDIDIYPFDGVLPNNIQLVLKIIPANDPQLRSIDTSNSPGHALNELNYISENAAGRLFSLHSENGTVDLRKEYKAGIYTVFFDGSISRNEERVRFTRVSKTYWPNPYQSLRDLEGKYIVAMISASGISKIEYGYLGIQLNTESGGRKIVMRFPVTSSHDPSRIIGGLVRNGQLLKGSF